MRIRACWPACSRCGPPAGSKGCQHQQTPHRGHQGPFFVVGRSAGCSPCGASVPRVFPVRGNSRIDWGARCFGGCSPCYPYFSKKIKRNRTPPYAIRGGGVFFSYWGSSRNRGNTGNKLANPLRRSRFAVPRQGEQTAKTGNKQPRSGEQAPPKPPPAASTWGHRPASSSQPATQPGTEPQGCMLPQ